MFKREFWSSATFTILVIIFFALSTYAISKYFERVEVKEQVGGHGTSKKTAPNPPADLQRRLER
jgi:hypothetical protein